MNIFDPVVSSSRAATAPASPKSWSGNCRATCKQKSRSQKTASPPPRVVSSRKTSWESRPNQPSQPLVPEKLLPSPPHPPIRTKSPRDPDPMGDPPRRAEPSSLTRRPHPLTRQVTDERDDSLQLVHSGQVRWRREQPRGPRLPLQRRLSRAAEGRLHEAQLGDGGRSVFASSKEVP